MKIFVVGLPNIFFVISYYVDRISSEEYDLTGTPSVRF